MPSAEPEDKEIDHQDQRPAKVLPLSGIIEYGTVLVYTCNASCWKGKPMQEMVIVQQEDLS